MLVCSYLLVYSLSNYFTHRLLRVINIVATCVTRV